MYLSVVTPPGPIVTTADAKKHLRVEHPDDDVYIDGLVAAATAWLDGPDGWLGRALGEQELELRLDDFAYGCRHHRHGIVLPCQPIRAVTSVTYIDGAGTVQTVDAAAYQLVRGRELVPAFGKTWPAARCEPDAVRVVYSAGYVAGTVPRPIVQAILLLVGQWYELREAALAMNGLTAAVELPFAVEALLAPYRVYA